jgi:hypothetical protein
MESGDPAFQRMCERQLARIEQMRAELPADGMIEIPFRCYGCDRQRYDFGLLTGDGLPLCAECFDGFVEMEKWPVDIGRGD